MAFGFVKRIFPSWQNVVQAVLAAGLLILAFPDFEYWFLAWFALVPLMWAVEREKESVVRSIVTGWIFGTIFFFGTCWWLTFAPIHYAGFPWWLAYSGMVFVALIVGVFPALFAAILSVLLRRFGSWAFLAAPFVWVFTEFLRYWLTGNNWNAVGYSQALGGIGIKFAQIGGVLITSFAVVLSNGFLSLSANWYRTYRTDPEKVPYFPLIAFLSGGWIVLADKQLRKDIQGEPKYDYRLAIITVYLFPLIVGCLFAFVYIPEPYLKREVIPGSVIAIQPNVPMSGIDYQKYQELRRRQIELAEGEIRKIKEQLTANSSQLSAVSQTPITVVLPESPMNFAYNDDREFQQFIGDFARRNGVSVLFNSAEPDVGTTKYFNSAVMVGPDGKEAAQYDKIYLLPFGEAVPSPLEGILPGFVGNFAYGREYDILPVGEAKAGVMICFESHFGALSREYVRKGADVLIEMTNDGYLGPTPVLRQHLASSVFRAVETNRPVLRVTNVGVTAYINERGQVLDPLPSYTEGTRVWSVAKSDGSQTFYVKFGDWFAWLCTIVTLVSIVFAVRKGRRKPEQ